MARYFLNLTDEQGVLIARFPIETDTARRLEYYEVADMNGELPPEDVYAPDSFGKNVQHEIEVHQKQ